MCWWIALLYKSSIPNELPIRPGVHASVGISDVSSPPPMPEMESSKLGWCCPVLLREPYDNVLHPKIHDFTSTILDFDRSAPEGKLMCRVSSIMLLYYMFLMLQFIFYIISPVPLRFNCAATLVAQDGVCSSNAAHLALGRGRTITCRTSLQ